MTVRRFAPPNGTRRLIHRLFPTQHRIRESAISWLAVDPIFAGSAEAGRL